MSTPLKTSESKPIAATPGRPIASSAPTLKSDLNSERTKSDQAFLFDKENYMLVFAGLALILLGFVLMSGGKSANPHEFHYDEIYSFRRITLAPIVLLSGIALEIYAIMKKPKN